MITFVPPPLKNPQKWVAPPMKKGRIMMSVTGSIPTLSPDLSLNNGAGCERTTRLTGRSPYTE
jgi:hypothetical protein